MGLTHKWKMLAAVGVLALFAAACPGDGDSDESLLAEVQDRGTLRCGINGQVVGFGFVDEGGAASGFDVEFCRAVAAAVLGNADAVEYRTLTAEQRFTTLQAGEIDVLIRNTTWTATRDGGEGAQFATTTFYDGQGMMVPADSDAQTLEDLAGETICVLSGTTTELNLASVFGAGDIDFDPLSVADNETLRNDFREGRCGAWTSDKSQLAAERSNWPDAEGGPDALRILDVTMSKEPLGPLVAQGDATWFDAVNWTVIATIQAEEFGINRSNVDQIRGSTDDPAVQRFLGVPLEGEEGAEPAPFDPGLDLPTDFAYQVVRQVGNYADIYDATVGPDTPVGLARGPNSLWTEGGLLYAPPYK